MAETVLAKMTVEISANAAKFTAGINQANTQFKGLTDSVNAAGKILNTFGIGFGVATILSGVRGVVDIMADFQHTMQEVKAITGATGPEFERLKKSALDLGAATKFSATEVGQLQAAFARVGFSTQEILDATEATLDLAAATGEDLAKAAEVAGSTLRGFGLEATEMQRVVDVMAASFNSTNLQLEDFTESMKFVAPIAAAAGVSIEETTAMLGVLADAGIKGSLAGTALRKIFGDLTKDGRPASERMAELGKNGLTLSGAFDEVGRTAQTALLVLTKNTEKSAQLTKELHNVDGVAKATAKTMGDDLVGDFEKASSAFEGLVLSGNALLEPLRSVVQAVTEVLNALTGLSNNAGPVSEFFTFLADQISGPVRLLGFLAKSISGTNKPLEDNAAKLKAISATVDAAFDSGNIEAYVKALDQNIYKAEIIEAIAKRQAAEQKAVNEEIKVQIGLIPSLEEKIKKFEEDKKKAFTVGEIVAFNDEIAKLKDQLEALNAVTTKPAKNLDDYRKILKALNDEFANTDTNDKAKLRVLSAQIQGYNDLIASVERVKDSFKDFDVTLKVPDLSGLLNPIKEIQVAAGAISFTSMSDNLTEVVKRVEGQMTKLAEVTKKGVVETAAAVLDLGALVQTAASGIGQALGNAIAGGANFGKALLGVLGGVLVQLGEMLITAGVGIIGFKLALKSLNGYVAIAAGIALVALGTAVGASIRNLGNSGGGGAGGSSGGGAGRTTSNVTNLSAVDTRPEDRIQGNVEFRIEGNALVGVLNNANNKKQRTG